MMNCEATMTFIELNGYNVASNPPQRNYEILTWHKKALAYSRTTNVELKIYASVYL